MADFEPYFMACGMTLLMRAVQKRGRGAGLVAADMSRTGLFARRIGETRLHRLKRIKFSQIS
ncbi:hypothetical protein [Campylobacter rectus]|uniref:hypothetical protein n=1 Tax=Campylobacter rectus TaxID=203 RepID=UPI000F5E2090|nr:hypothetical protein [Campylobacter rectus]RRD55534.1 hypothetical protein EII16_00640 [Campylobacter rectus]